MIIKSNRKESGSIEVKLQNIDGSSYLLERKDHIKYLGIMFDETFFLELPHLLYLLSYLIKHWRYFKIKVLSFYSST